MISVDRLKIDILKRKLGNVWGDGRWNTWPQLPGWVGMQRRVSCMRWLDINVQLLSYWIILQPSYPLQYSSWTESRTKILCTGTVNSLNLSLIICRSDIILILGILFLFQRHALILIQTLDYGLHLGCPTRGKQGNRSLNTELTKKCWIVHKLGFYNKCPLLQALIIHVH